jgi:hypothetical protein
MPMMNTRLSGLIAKFINSYSDLKTARVFLGQIKEQVFEEKADKNQVKRHILREISVFKMRSERQYALDANTARSLSPEAKKERKMGQVSEDFYALAREIKALEVFFRVYF